MYFAVVAFIGLMGAIMGSFVGALTWRIHKNMDFVRGRSECEHCHHKLGTADLIPIISWLVLGGRCRYCQRKIGVLAVALELSTAALFVVSFVFWPFGEIYKYGSFDYAQGALLGLWLAILVIMIALFVYDSRWRLLPNKLVFPLIGLSLVFAILNNIFIQNNNLQSSTFEILLSMIPISGVYGLIYMMPPTGRLVGLGDVKLGIAIGLILGWKGALLVLVLSNLLGSIVAVPMLVRGKTKMKSQMAFGPFLIAATVAVFFLGNDLLKLAIENLLLM